MIRRPPQRPPAGDASRGALEVVPTEGTALLQVERVSKLYPVGGGWLSRPRFVRALDAVSLGVHRAQILGVLGESGSGRTTLLRTMLRLSEPNLGRVLFDGVDITHLSERALAPLRRRMQLVFDTPLRSLNPSLDVQALIREGLDIHGIFAARSERAARVEELLHVVGLRAEVLHHKPTALGSGDRQRVALARSLAVQPELLVCDEALNHLDPESLLHLERVLVGLRREQGTSLVLATHDVAQLVRLCDRLVVLHHGRIVEDGPAPPLLTAPRHPYTRALLDAAPSPGSDRRAHRVTLQGPPPDPLGPLVGCAFRSRCPRAERGRCDHDVPVLAARAPGSEHRVACWLPLGS